MPAIWRGRARPASARRSRRTARPRERDTAARAQRDGPQRAAAGAPVAVGRSAMLGRSGLAPGPAQVAGVLVGAVGPHADAAAKATLLGLAHPGRVSDSGGRPARVGGSTSGSGSPTGIAWCLAARRPARARPPTAAASGWTAGRPRNVARSSQRGPLTPTIRDGCMAVVPSGGDRHLADQLGAEPALALGGGAAPLRDVGGDLGRTSLQRSPSRGAAKARSSSAPSGPASITDCTSPAGLVDLEPQLLALAAYQQRAEVDPLARRRRGPRDVDRSRFGGRDLVAGLVVGPVVGPSSSESWPSSIGGGCLAAELHVGLSAVCGRRRGRRGVSGLAGNQGGRSLR